MSATGRYLDADGNVLNLVSILGSGATPISEQVHALEQYAPHSGLILGEDGKAYSLVDIIANYKAQLQTESEGYTDGKIDALTGADIALADAGGHYTTKTAEAALQQVASQLAENANNHMLATELSGAYTGIDLTQRYADVIANYYGGSPWAFMQAVRVAGDFSGLHIHDYIPVTCSNAGAYILKPEIAGVNIYKGAGDTEIGNHIDLIVKDCWPDTVQYNKVDYNNATTMDKWVATAGQTAFQLTRRADGTYPALSSITVNGTSVATYTYDATAGVLTYTGASLAAGVVVKAIWTTPILVPFLASHLNAFINSLRMGVPNEAAADPLLTEVDYSAGGVYNFLPADLKAVIRPKRMLLAQRSTPGSLLTNPTTYVWVDVGPLWVPDEMEVYGTYHYASNVYDRAFTRQYPAFLGGNLRKGAGNGGSQSIWWLLPAYSGAYAHVCVVGSTGFIGYAAATTTTMRAPVGFRI